MKAFIKGEKEIEEEKCSGKNFIEREHKNQICAGQKFKSSVCC